MAKKPLIRFAEDPISLRQQIDLRLEKIDRSLNQLCKVSKVSISTVWRWSQGSQPNIGTITKLENQLKCWEAASRKR